MGLDGIHLLVMAKQPDTMVEKQKKITFQIHVAIPQEALEIPTGRATKDMEVHVKHVFVVQYFVQGDFDISLERTES